MNDKVQTMNNTWHANNMCGKDEIKRLTEVDKSPHETTAVPLLLAAVLRLGVAPALVVTAKHCVALASVSSNSSEVAITV